MRIYVKFDNNGELSFYNNLVHKEIPNTAIEIPQEVYDEFLNNQETKTIHPETLRIVDKTKNIDEEKDKVLALIKREHINFMNSPQKIGDYYFTPNDNLINQFAKDIANAESLNLTSVMSRDYYNNYFSFSINDAKQIYLKLWIIQKLSFIKKWLLEVPIKSCGTMVKLDSINKDFNIVVTENEINQLLAMTNEQRNSYIQQQISLLN